MPTKINNLISDFLEYLKKQGRSDLTVRNYELYLKRFLKFAKNISPNEINEEMIEEYKEWLRNLREESRLIRIKKNFKKNTINYHLIALRSFLKYLDEKKINSLKPENIELAQMPKVKKNSLSKTETEKLLNAPLKLEADRIIQFRDKAILEVLFSTGIRVGEMAKLKRKDALHGIIKIKNKKGKVRQVELTNQAKHYLKKYLHIRTDKVLALFVGHDRAARARKIKKLIPQSNLTARSIQRIVRKYALSAGITNNITPQVLRNTATITLLAKGEDERATQTMMGHASVMTTREYGSNN